MEINRGFISRLYYCTAIDPFGYAIVRNTLWAFVERTLILRPWNGFKGYRDIGQKLKEMRDIFVISKGI